MDEAEEGALLEVQRRYVETIAVDHPFKSADLRQMHRDWLGAIYPWAGNYRTVEMSKGGFVWPPARLVGQNMERFERDTLKRLMPLAGEDDAIIARALAEVQADLLLIHPFREGNGRLSRWFVDLLAMQGGRGALNYGFLGRGSRQRRAMYLRGVVEGYKGNYEPLALVLAEALRRPLADGAG